MSLGQKLKALEIHTRLAIGRDISTPRNRFWAKVDTHLFDHAFLRKLWRNFGRVAPGVYRGNQPDAARVKQLAEMGIKTIVNLRGVSELSSFLFEKEAAEAHGIKMENVALSARHIVARANYVELIDVFRRAEQPIFIHCKSGADRAGVGSVIYRLVIEGHPLDDALEELSSKYLHFNNKRTGICDELFEMYRDAHAETGISFEEWVSESYDPAKLLDRFRAKWQRPK